MEGCKSSDYSCLIHTTIPLIHLLATMESNPHTMRWNPGKYITVSKVMSLNWNVKKIWKCHVLQQNLLTFMLFKLHFVPTFCTNLYKNLHHNLESFWNGCTISVKDCGTLFESYRYRKLQWTQLAIIQILLSKTSCFPD